MIKSFFAASNSAQGFKNYFGECFARADRLFIVKGGPGTGKSTFIRRVAEAADTEGFECEVYFCSSDHTSLDGALFGRDGGWVGIIDGTYPHPYIERLPGVREEILNTGMFWNRRRLALEKEKIIGLCSQKSAQYDRAYLYLRACGNLRAVMNSYTRDVLNIDKMKACISRMMKNVCGEGYASLPALVNCIGMKGEAHLDTFEREAERIFVLRGDVGESVFLLELDRYCQKKGLSIRTAYNPIYDKEIDGIYIEGVKYWFVVEGALGEGGAAAYEDKIKHINMQRFILKDLVKSRQSDIRYCRRLLDTCVGEAKKCLSRVGDAHFELEEIYKSCMDFKALDTYMNESCGQILGG